MSSDFFSRCFLASSTSFTMFFVLTGGFSFWPHSAIEWFLVKSETQDQCRFFVRNAALFCRILGWASAPYLHSYRGCVWTTNLALIWWLDGSAPLLLPDQRLECLSAVAKEVVGQWLALASYCVIIAYVWSHCVRIDGSRFQASIEPELLRKGGSSDLFSCRTSIVFVCSRKNGDEACDSAAASQTSSARSRKSSKACHSKKVGDHILSHAFLKAGGFRARSKKSLL